MGTLNGFNVKAEGGGFRSMAGPPRLALDGKAKVGQDVSAGPMLQYGSPGSPLN